MKKQRQQRPLKKTDSGLPQIDSNPFNQTIIINNPNININYIGEGSKAKNNKTIVETTLYNPKNESNGLDTWNLNKNLKQFSETRQLGFFKNGNSEQSRNKHPSPYLITKNKTQDIRNGKNSKLTNVNSFRQQKTLSTIKKQTLTPLSRESENSESKTTFRTKPYNVKKPRNPSQTPINYKLQLYSNATINDKKLNIKDKVQSITERKKPNLQIRKNRFERIQTPESLENEISRRQNQTINNGEEIENEDLGDSKKKDEQLKSPRRIIQKSIDKISNCFLKKVDNYFDEIETVDMPSSKIQLYTTTIGQPNTGQSSTLEYRSIHGPSQGYDYQFEDDKPRKRPKTPYKRKKVYEQF